MSSNRPRLRLKKFTFRKKNTSNTTSPTKKASFKQTLKTLVLIAMLLATLGGFLGISYIVVVLQGAPTISVADFESSQSSKVYDATGTLVADVGLQIRDNISYDDLPQNVINAFVSIEDSRFFEHNGFDLPRFTKAILENITSLSFGQGGSTFTMQLVKGTYFETEEATAVRSGLAGVNRKIREIYTAIQTEKVLSKKRIFELYLNKINYGVPGNRRGIQTAAQYYFGKDVQNVSLVEAAFLAGVINAPNAYNPMKNLDLAQERTLTVLYQMNRHGYISDEEYNLAKTVKLENLLVGSSSSVLQSIPYQAYVDAVVNEVIELTGLDPINVPMKIYTSMDQTTQRTIEAIQNGEVSSVVWPNDIIQTGIVSMNNKTGEVIAIGGGRFYNGERLYNRAIDMTRQPGSSAKTILTYPLAFENIGWATTHMLEDKPIKYEGIDVIVKNFDGVYRGDILIPAAIGNSLNIPAIETLTAVVDTIGTKKVVSYLNSIGFEDVTVENFDIGYAIGGSMFEASPLQMAAANSAMINGGNYIQPHTVTRIEFVDGTEPITPSYSSTSVLSSEAAYMTTMMMEQDVSGPYGNFQQILRRDFQVYSKTGTSDWGETGVEYGIPKGSAKDKWMMASTSEFTTAVWVGYDKAVKDQISYLDQAQINLNLPGKINNAILTSLYAKRAKPANVVRPNGVVDITHVMGIYPYVAPNSSTNPNLVVTGLIKSEYANLSTLSSPQLSNPTSFTGTVSANGLSKTFTFKLNDYPDANALYVAPATKDFSLTVGDQTVTATGQRLFDYSWIYGPVKYRLKLTVDGQTVQELQSDSSSFTTTLTVNDTSTVVACGYYGYEYVSVNSSELCQTFKMTDLYLTVPDFSGKTLAEFQSFMSANGLSYSVSEVIPTNLSGLSSSNIGKVLSITSNTTTSSLDKTKLAQYSFQASILDGTINPLSDFANLNRPNYCNLISCTVTKVASGGSAGSVVSVTSGSTAITGTTKLSSVAGGLTISIVNTPPTVSPSSTLSLSKNQSTSITLSDADGDTVTASVTSAPSLGTATINTDRITYTASSTIGTDTFTISVSDGISTVSYTYSVTITN